MKKILTLITMLVLSFSLFGQSDEILDLLYEDDNANTLYTAMLVLQAVGDLDEDSTLDEALSYLENVKWGETVLGDGDYITAGSFSLLLMENFNIPKGVMYRILPIKRYALRDVVYNGYILGSPYPKDIMTSFDVVYALSSVPVDESINKGYENNTPVEEIIVESQDVEADTEVEIIEVQDDAVVESGEVAVENSETVVESDEVAVESSETVAESDDVAVESDETTAENEDVTVESDVTAVESEDTAEDGEASEAVAE